MSQSGEEWAGRLTKGIGNEVRRHRQEKGWSVQRLSDEIEQQHGVTIKRPVLSNLEHGRRPTIAIDELFVLADVLGVPAVLLLFPLGRDGIAADLGPVESVEPLPGVDVTPWEALEWAERGGKVHPWGIQTPADGTVHLFREHEKGVALWRRAGREVRAAERLLAGHPPEPGVKVEVLDDPDEIRAHREHHERELVRLPDAVRHIRALIRNLGLMPPDLPLGLRHLDDPVHMGRTVEDSARADDTVRASVTRASDDGDVAKP